MVDLYTAEVMEAVADFGKLPRPVGGFDSLARIPRGFWICIADDSAAGRSWTGWPNTGSPQTNGRDASEMGADGSVFRHP